MDIVDSKPWGSGDSGDGALMTPGRTWPLQTCPEAAVLGYLEGRHPLALGHLVNHPPAGVMPNVVEVPFDWEAQKVRGVCLRIDAECGIPGAMTGQAFASRSDAHVVEVPLGWGLQKA